MKIIELERWTPKQNDSRYVEYAGSRTAKEVFSELKYRLESMGFLPEEYFLMDRAWEDGREIPKGADIFCTTDYGSSEGVYLDVYLKWYEEGKPVIESFITGKTLGESGNDLDRMFLISAEITKAFHGDRGTYDRYIKLGKSPESEERIFSLSADEQRTFLHALVRQRETQLEDVEQTEKLLRRMTGSITAYMDLVGQRPLRISDYDQAVLAIHDGELAAFSGLLPKALHRKDELLIETASRPGAVGQKMLTELLEQGESFSRWNYLVACKRAVDLGDTARVQSLLEQAEECCPGREPSLHGEVIGYAYYEHRHMAGALIQQARPEWISAAEPELLYRAAMAQDYQNCVRLLDMGAPTGNYAADLLRTILIRDEGYWGEKLLEHGMEVQPTDYRALGACLDGHAEDLAKRLIDRGIDLEQYLAWEQKDGITYGDTNTRQAVQDYWTARQTQEAPEQSVQQQTQESGGMQMGGISL